MNNYKKMFEGEKRFKINQKITNQELLEKYSYENYLRENKNGRTA